MLDGLPEACRSDPEEGSRQPWTSAAAAQTTRRARDRALAADRDATQIDVGHLSGTGSPRRSAEDVDDAGAAWRALAAEREHLDQRESELIRKTLDKHRGVLARVAAELGVARSSLQSRLQTLGIKSGAD